MKHQAGGETAEVHGNDEASAMTKSYISECLRSSRPLYTLTAPQITKHSLPPLHKSCDFVRGDAHHCGCGNHHDEARQLQAPAESSFHCHLLLL